MIWHGRSAVFALLIWALATAQAPAQPAPLAGLDSYVEGAMREWEAPGVVIGVVQDDRLIFAKGYGVREKGTSDRVDPDTVFALGSITKTFTAAAVGLLVEKGKLEWDDRLARHLPELRLRDACASRDATVRDALSHRTGLPELGGDFVAYASNYSRAELVRRMRFIPPAVGFRSGFGYSNQMYVALGEIVARASGASWDDFLRQRFFAPLGMTRTTTRFDDARIGPNVATPHSRIDETIRPLPARDFGNLGPAVGVFSTVKDLALWARMLLADGEFDGRRILARSTVVETRVPHTPIRIGRNDRILYPWRHFFAYGLGWFLEDDRGRLVLMHGGGIVGSRARMALVPEERLAVIVLSNLSRQRLHTALVYRVLDACLGAPATDWSALYRRNLRERDDREAASRKAFEEKRRLGTATSLPLSRYTGAYMCEHYGTAYVSQIDEALNLTLDPRPGLSARLEHWHDDMFRVIWNDPVLGEGFTNFHARNGAIEFSLKGSPGGLDPLEYRFVRQGTK
jgi:CubicO group peptidase (beta-lactamase class C family)